MHYFTKIHNILNIKRLKELCTSVLILFNILYCPKLLSQKLNEKVEEFNRRNFKEELYIRTDRDIYITGEQVWFKVYKMNWLK